MPTLVASRPYSGNGNALTAAEPPEHRGLTRDGVRLLVASPESVTHTRFWDLPSFLSPGDLLVVNNSATVAAAIDARRVGMGDVVLHAGTELDDGTWVVELRSAPDAVAPVLDAAPGEKIDVLGGQLRLTLVEAFPNGNAAPHGEGNRLWRARVDRPVLRKALHDRGRPVAYGYLDRRYPLEDYQTVFGTRVGSAEIPSAARPFTPELVTRLVASGVSIAAVTLHTGLSSQDAGEPPQPERFEVTPATARLVNSTKSGGGRVIAVGTTVTRALETAAGGGGLVAPSAGWTDRVVSPDEPARVVDGLITGWHNPDASHLLLVESVAGVELTRRAYAAAMEQRYLWHEFGDSSLFLPDHP